MFKFYKNLEFVAKTLDSFRFIGYYLYRRSILDK